MIDVQHEQLVPVREVPGLLPQQPRSGKRIHISAVYRWIKRGVRGVRLEAVKIGGTTYTSLEALQRFTDRCTSAHSEPDDRDVPQAPRARQRRQQQARRRVEQILGPDRKHHLD